MKKYKKLLTLTSAVMCLALAGCGGDDGGSATEADNSGKKDSAVTTEAKDNDSSETKQSGGDETEIAETTEAPTEAAAVEAVNALSLEEIKAQIVVDDKISPVLTEVGTFELPKDDYDYLNLSFYDDLMYITTRTDHGLYYVDYNGNRLFDCETTFMKKMEYSNYFTYSVADGEFGYVGLLDPELNVVLSTDEGINHIEECDDGRFIECYYYDHKTEDKTEAVYDSYDGAYVGTRKIYDMQERKFLDFTETNRSYRYKPIGDIIISFEKYDTDNTYVCYRLDGSSFEVNRYDRFVTNDLIACNRDGVTTVYDHDMNVVFTTSYDVEGFGNTSEFCLIRDGYSGPYGVIHRSGTVIIEPKYDEIIYLENGLFSFKNSETYTYGVVNMDGVELLDDIYKWITCFNFPGYYCVRDADDNRFIYNEDFELVNQHTNFMIDEWTFTYYLPYYMYAHYYSSEEDMGHFFCLKDEDFTITANSTTSFGANILYDGMGRRLVNLVTGDVLAEGFDQALASYGYVYIVKDHIVTTYKVSLEAF
ncbi:MAG: WG repeat-containing protein [Lachnospiraceae bacterium]|nr:WG repeat-containing protein [Lachnospiraceae bacterium]